MRATWVHMRERGTKMGGTALTAARERGRGLGASRWLAILFLTLLGVQPGTAQTPSAPRTFTVNVVDGSRTVGGSHPAIGLGFRWVLEEDVTYDAENPLTRQDDNASLALNLNKSYMPVAATGHSASASAAITVPDGSKRYLLSVLPDQSLNPGAADDTPLDCQHSGNCFTQSGKQLLPSSPSTVTLVVTPQPLPTAQIHIRAFEDRAPINTAWDDGEPSIGERPANVPGGAFPGQKGFAVFIYDMGGQLNTDTYGNPLGTVYEGLDRTTAVPRVKRLGDGTIHTLTEEEVNDPIKNPYGLAVGEALIKNIAPGRYGVRVVPTQGEGWQQTSTIEGTPGQDAWVKAGEPRYFAEFGPAGHHAEFGFVRTQNFARLTGSGSITGQVTNLRMSRPPLYQFSSGHPLPGCWIGLNDSAGLGVYAGPCADTDGDGIDSEFRIAGVPAGTYQLVVFDKYLDLIVNMQAVDVGVNGADLSRTLGPVPTFRWFGAQDHYVFYDRNGDGQRQDDEQGIPEQTVNLRYRDGSIYASSTTDGAGFLPFDEVFPFFSWLVAEVDFARFNATGVTVATDAGGAVDDGPIGRGKINPQPQDPAAGGTNCAGGSCQTRTEVTGPGTAPPLVEGYNAFIGSTAIFEWGKRDYAPGENGGITGVVYYQVTRAEDDPRFAAAETWEPGIPRVQVDLYRSNAAGDIDGTYNGVAGVQLADVDNYPFCWAEGCAGVEDVDANGDGIFDAGSDQDNAPLCWTQTCKGPEDVKRNDLASADVFDAGDAVEVTHTDSWDDSPPRGCVADPNDPAPLAPKNPDGSERCFDGLRSFNQVRPAVFDGGYAFGKPFTDTPLAAGNYVVEAVPPRGASGATYLIQREQDKNVDFGDTMTISPQALPPQCVGDNHLVPRELALFPGVAAKYGDQTRRLCDRKVVIVADGKNAAADFFMFTETPVAGHIKGFILNDLANEFDPLAPNFGEKYAPSFLPVSIRDYAGHEVYHTTSDQWGTYNAIVPSAFRINTPMPSGVSPNMLQVCLNSPTREDPANPTRVIPDPNYNPQYTQFCYTFDFKPGATTYLDTPVLPIAAYTGPNNWQLDCEYPDHTPVIAQVSANNNGVLYSNGVQGGPFVRTSGSALQRTLTLTSLGTVNVPAPLASRVDGANNTLTPRDFGFGTPPAGTDFDAASSAWRVTLGGVRLQITSWSNGGIQAVVPATASTGQLEVTRGDFPGNKPGHAITVIVGSATTAVLTVASTESIQSKIDQARAGDVVLVQPGLYREMLIVTKPVQLQGWGAPSTIINPLQSPSEKLAAWRIKVNSLANCSHELGLLGGQANNIAASGAPCGFTPGTGLFANDEGAGVLVAPVAGRFNGPARIDGFKITGADQSAGILVNGNASFLEISNNIVANNQGSSAAGIRIGHPTLLTGDDSLVDANNDRVRIHHNHVTQNGGLFEPGAGIGLYNGSDFYQVSSNYVCGNFAQADGGGIAHYGRSNNGLIADNRILLNQSFDQTAGAGGHGGGILIAGHDPIGAGALSTGSGSVKVLRNLIQANNAGSGDGGGIALRFVNGADAFSVSAAGSATATRNRFFAVDILQNTIVNNVAGLAGGGISLQDALNVSIVNDSISNNDSTATAAGAFPAGSPNVSSPQPAGIVARAHSTALAAARAALGGGAQNTNRRDAIGTFSDPRLVNDIVLGNRRQHWGGCNPGEGATGCELITDAYDSTNDLAVLGIAGQLSPSFSLLSTGTPQGTGSNNTFASPSATDAGSTTVFVNPYRNAAPGFVTVQPDGTVVPGGEFPITAAAALDEGGNFIDVHFGPLTLLGDYHLAAGANVALNSGTPNNSPLISGSGAPYAANRSPDFDGEVRPRGGGTTNASLRFDIGSDEIQAGTPPSGSGDNTPPEIVSRNPSPFAFVGQLYTYQVIALDPNFDTLSYSLQAICIGIGVSNRATPAGMSINNATGLLTYLPTSTATGCPLSRPIPGVRITVSDGRGGTDQQQFPLAAVAANGATAVSDTITITRAGPFTVPAPGVLANDSSAFLPCTLVIANCSAQLLTNLEQGGSVSLETNGALVYTPDPTFTGTATFTYQARNAAGGSTAQVTLVRQLAVTDAQFQPSTATWTASGFSSIIGSAGNERTLSFTRARGNVALGSTIVGPDGSWIFEAINAATVQTGDTLTVVASGGGAPNFTLTGVPVLALTAANAPLSTSYVQCPGDTNGDAVIDTPSPQHPRAVCKHLAAGDGFAVMGDGSELYTFGFSDVTGQPANLAIDKGILNAQFPAPTLKFSEGDEVYLTLTNVGMIKRPDLFDPHSVHFHGFPNAAAVFDGVPESSISINMGFSLTYYYKIVEPGTFMYHCHVEAAEHMQMGMLGNLYVEPAQNGTPHTFEGATYTHFVYNDGDGSTGYDTGTVDGVADQPLDFPIQIGSFDANFHREHLAVQPLPFAQMRDDYPMLNGRGYPDTVSDQPVPVASGGDAEKVNSGVTSAAESSQKMHSIIRAQAGKRILLRISNLNVTRFYTLATTGGLQMQIVGTGAHILRGPGGSELYYKTGSVTLGGGEAVDVLIDTASVAPGRYLLYSTNLDALSNGPEDFGGMMTEIIVE